MDPSKTNSAPRVSVVMPSYNTAALIGASLDSVFQQSFRDFEVIVVNDGSPDTEELEKALAPYLSDIIYIRQENKRAAGARNTAIKRSRGEFLAFLDSDDVWLPAHLAAQMKLFDADPGLGLVYSNCLSSGDPGRPHTFMDRCPSEGPANFATLAVERCQIPISTVVARKSALEKAGLFDESMMRCDDYDMWLRAAFHGARIAYTRNVQARLNEGRPGSLGASNVKMIEAYWQILEKARTTLPLSGADREIVQKRADQIHGRYLLEEGKMQLAQGQYEQAREYLSRANTYLRNWKVALTLLGLRTAPHITRRAFAFASRMRAGTAAS
jgi:glycosyltransferase involved in cell wall biosynthesis